MEHTVDIHTQARTFINMVENCIYCKNDTVMCIYHSKDFDKQSEEFKDAYREEYKKLEKVKP